MNALAISPFSSPFLHPSTYAPAISFSAEIRIAIVWHNTWAIHEYAKGNSLQGRVHHLQSFLFKIPLLGKIIYFFISIFGCKDIDLLLKQSLEAKNINAAWLLVNLEANPQLKNQKGETLFDLLVQKRSPKNKFSPKDLKMALFLIKKKVKLSHADQFLPHMLTQALKEHQTSLVIELLKKNITPSISWEQLQKRGLIQTSKQNGLNLQKHFLKNFVNEILPPPSSLLHLQTFFSSQLLSLKTIPLQMNSNAPLILSNDTLFISLLIKTFTKILEKEGKKIGKVNFSTFHFRNLPALLSFLKNNPNIILYAEHFESFLQENKNHLHLLTQQLQNIIKTKRVIFSLSSLAYKNHLQKDTSLNTLFTSLKLPKLTQDNIAIPLKYLAKKLEKHHDVSISDEGIKAVIHYAHRTKSSLTLSNYFNIIDTTAARLYSENILSHQKKERQRTSLQIQYNYLKNLPSIFSFQTAPLIKATLAKIKETKIDPLHKSTLTKTDIMKTLQQLFKMPLLLKKSPINQNSLYNYFSQHVIGQKYAIQSLTEALMLQKARLYQDQKNPPSFHFCGPSGCGKTELALTLARLEKKQLIRFNMGEFTSEYMVSRFIGAPPGLVGYQEGGELTNQLKKSPNAVVFFDEIDKTHPKCLNILYSLLEGNISDSKGEKINCTEIIVIMTSNMGLNAILNYKNSKPSLFYPCCKKKSPKKNLEILIDEELHASPHFTIPLIGRIQKTIPFFPLTFSNLKAIAKLKLKQLQTLLKKEQSIELKWTPQVEIGLAQETMNNHHELYGARILNKLINCHIKTLLANAICNKNIDDPLDLLCDYTQLKGYHLTHISSAL